MARPTLYNADGTRMIRASAYDVAGPGRRARAVRGFGGGPNTVSRNLYGLRSKSRDAVRNNWAAASAVDTIVTNTVGTGIKPQFATSDSGLNKELAELWLDWTDEADADGVLDLYGLEALACRGMVEGGDVFARLRVRRACDVDTVPLQLQLLEGEYCPAEKTEDFGANGRTVNGIRLDAIGRRVGYWLYRGHPADGAGFAGAEVTLVPASEVCHVYLPLRPGQMRGEPWLTRALTKLADLDKYDDAEVLRKQISAMFVGFRRRPIPAGATAEEIAELYGVTPEEGDGPLDVIMEPGAFNELDPGEEMQFTDPADVGTHYADFMRVQFRMLAAAAGVLYEQLTGDYSQINDRTYRAAVNEFRRRVQMWQHHVMAFQLLRRVHRRWLDLAILSGAIRVPQGVRGLYRAKWVPQAWEYIHPVQDVEAARASVRAGFTSRAAVVSERGEDAEQIDAEQAADNERADDLGLSYDSDGRRSASDPSKAAGAADEPENEDQQ